MRQNSRDKILETARALFPKHGFNGISIRSIAAKARLTTGAVYFHFKNKKEIYRAICREAADLLIDIFRRKMDARKTPNQKLISTFDAYLEFYYNHPDYYNILMEAKADYDSSEDDDSRAGFKDVIHVSEEPIRMGIEQGIFREIDPRKLAVLLAALTEGMLQYKKLGILEILDIKDAEFRKFMADVIGKGIGK
jgi:AcrR family transcriptional regulator